MILYIKAGILLDACFLLIILIANFVFTRFISCMKTEKVDSKSFSAIKLSSNNEQAARRLVKYMRINGFSCVGKKTYYMNNNFENKVKASNFIRDHYRFYENEFGVLFLPWSKEAYILSEPANEQTMLEWVQEMDPKACINLII